MRVSSKSIAVLAALTVVLTLGCAGTQQSGNNRRPFKKHHAATIFFLGPDASSCTSKVAPNLVQPKKNEVIDWTVIDICGLTAGYTKDVEIAFPSSNSATCDGKKDPLLAPVKGKTFLSGEVSDKCSEGDLFTYVVKVDGVDIVDPELEIGQ